MTLLSSKRVAETLTTLHAEAEAADHDFGVELMARLEASGTSIEEALGQLIAAERADYRATYRDHAEHFLAVSPAYGRFLYAIVRARRATRIVEFGTSMGISTIYLAAALRDNGGGQLIGSEIEPTKVTRARAHLEAAGLADLVEIREGDALDTLRDVGGEVDVLSIDGAFSLYLPVLKLIEPRLAPGAVILGENAFAQDYLDYVRAPANGYFSRPFDIDEGRGNEFTVRVG
ncbi:MULTISPECIES: class I SAM-dependent methyltransferase [Rhodopseudomonas]|uniref:Methyltransferase n=1 Tax=Rhodopseudomonas palustris TaxID=1076 RepID=A0A0D7E9A5_RHOPL|nr:MULTISPECIES: class I SAM-dependent methyltransferase [Rhodopseudomonas]KIZ37434.1 methyltransferase [Rhodopseudomonas palustris]MDF3810793.1 class I SAM-dependent methyltransferase [Rhodopseudomonas sp. BAL398]WOK17054.1 class I SAM-dependent methyltransferase [Rhodopseudomonas sp. BAL398]